MLIKHEITQRLALREHPQSDGLVERMVQTMKWALRKCLLDGGGEDWDELLPYMAMGYKMSKQKSVVYSPYFFMFGRDPILQSRLQNLKDVELDLAATAEQPQVFLDAQGQAFRRVMPLAMRNLAIATRSATRLCGEGAGTAPRQHFNPTITCCSNSRRRARWTLQQGLTC